MKVLKAGCFYLVLLKLFEMCVQMFAVFREERPLLTGSVCVMGKSCPLLWEVGNQEKFRMQHIIISEDFIILVYREDETSGLIHYREERGGEEKIQGKQRSSSAHELLLVLVALQTDCLQGCCWCFSPHAFFLYCAM